MLVLVLTLSSAGPAAARDDGFPALRPLDEVLSAAGGGRLTTAGGQALSARAEALRARARALRARTVVDAPTRARIEALAAAPRP